MLREMGLPAPYAESRPLEVADLELAAPGPGELLVRVGAAGLCHSDLSVIDGSRPRVMPMVLGHEAAGEVVEVGAWHRGLRRGRPRGDVLRALVRNLRALPRRPGPALCDPGAVANGAGSLLSGERRWSHDGDAGRCTTTSGSRPSPTTWWCPPGPPCAWTDRCPSTWPLSSAAPCSPGWARW
ncbi:MAG: alcohol dehydrogenase catalytic domain-containing protein [Thermoleophilaceae bacterium]